ncbi:hypothetical protein [Gordonia sp. (in: high G+C Gram-positive bacteria)]
MAGRDTMRARLDAHARGDTCDACGTTQWPHGDDDQQPSLFDESD